MMIRMTITNQQRKNEYLYRKRVVQQVSGELQLQDHMKMELLSHHELILLSFEKGISDVI